ncbi:MAG: exodeoxyribonuclease III [Acidocella sp.]|nr:exodeoxyribonuclease III [Acidocella sp.]
MPHHPVAAVLRSPLTKITTWNVNSVRIRESHVADFLVREQPDLLLLQEIKCEEHQFPALAFSDLGYKSVVVGQKSYNGVAILHKAPVHVTHRKLPGMTEADSHSRYIEVSSGNLIVGNLYLPNGNSNGDEGYAYKLEWLENLRKHANAMLETDKNFILAGDYNVCPTDADFAPGAIAKTDALVRPQTRAAYNALIWLGLTEAVRALHPNDTLYTFWDYQAGAWDRNSGLRIDHALLSPRVAERLNNVTIHKAEREKNQPSDHVPVTIELAN